MQLQGLCGEAYREMKAGVWTMPAQNAKVCPLPMVPQTGENGKGLQLRIRTMQGKEIGD